MLIRKIEFKNYRCFLDGKIEFQSDKPINLVLGINGSGKTELLYAISYALHGFDFSILKSKENIPHSLNSRIYQELHRNPTVYDAFSEVTLTFDHEIKGRNRKYVLTRREDYKKNRKSSETESVSLYSYNEIGEKSTLETDKDKIQKIIEQIIPQKVLAGVIFDGERMRNLSSEDENSIKAIEGTIEDVTNLKLFTSLINDLDGLEKKYIREIRKIGRRTDNKEMEEVAEELSNLKDEYVIKENQLIEKKNLLPKIERKIEELSFELKEFNEAKVLENERSNDKKNLEKTEKEVNKIKDSLRDKEFKNISSILAEKRLLFEVNELIENNKLPKGLTSNAVESILDSEACICGRPHTSDTIHKMTELISILPPENLNALINEWVLDLDSLGKSKNSEIDEIFDVLEEKQDEIQKYKENINFISAKISSIDNFDLNQKDKEKQEFEEKKVNLISEIDTLNKLLNAMSSSITQLTLKQTEISKYDEKANTIEKKLAFIKKAIAMVDRIKEINMNRALKEINEFMSLAFKDISEDYDRGRRVYITQFIKEKYKLVAYYETALKEYQQSAEKGMLNKKYKELDLNNKDHLNEAIIMEIAENNSTGQSKIMTMSFVKAILDFSSKSKKDEFSAKKQYPLVLDAPFSEISGENLEKSAKNLYKFNEQIILLSDPNTYEPLKKYLNDKTGSVAYLDKNDDESSTTIRKG